MNLIVIYVLYGLAGLLFILAGGFAFGNNQSGNFSQTGNVYQGLETYSRILGKHTLKFGADVRNQRLHQVYFYDVSGGFSFTGGGTNDVGFSSLLPNYLLGLPDSYTQGSANSVDVRTTQFDFFGQDAWKLVIGNRMIGIVFNRKDPLARLDSQVFSFLDIISQALLDYNRRQLRHFQDQYIMNRKSVV